MQHSNNTTKFYGKEMYSEVANNTTLPYNSVLSLKFLKSRISLNFKVLFSNLMNFKAFFPSILTGWVIQGYCLIFSLPFQVVGHLQTSIWQKAISQKET